MTELSSRQFIMISIYLIISSKLMSMPILLFNYAGKEAIFAIILNFIFELLIAFLICEVIKRNPNTSLFELLKKKFSIIGAYIILIILYAFILFKFAFVLQELYSFFKEFLYDDFMPIIFAIPTFFVVGYLAFKGARTMGRTFEILFWFILIGIIVTIACNLEFVTFTRLVPYFENGITPMLDGSLKSLFYFGNSIPLLFFIGKVQITNKFTTKVICSTTGLALFITAFCFIFYDVYGMAVPYSLFALSDFSQYDPFILDLQRLSWLSTMVDVTKLFCSASIFLYCLGQSGKSMFKLKSSFYPILITILITYILATILNYDLDIMKHFIANYLSYATIGVMALTIIISIILSFNRRENEQKFIQ